MRRTMLVALGVVALALAVPGAALAHKGHGHHKSHHHGLKRTGHHASIHFEHFGAATTTASGASETGPGTGSGTGTNSTPTTAPAPENAGTIASYNSSTGLLVLTLNNKSTVEGNVTSNTEIKCVQATSTTVQSSGQPSDQSQGDDNGQGDDQSRGDMSQQGDQQSSDSEEQSGDGQDNSGEDQAQAAPEAPCDSAALVAGAVVRYAELRIGPSGSEFETIVLAR